MNIINLANEVNALDTLYLYKKIGRLNKHILSVVLVENRILPFHYHEQSDELFYVIEGTFTLEIKEESYILNTGECFIVPKGIVHRPVVQSLCKFLMMELEGTLNKENSGDSFEDDH